MNAFSASTLIPALIIDSLWESAFFSTPFYNGQVATLPEIVSP